MYRSTVYRGFSDTDNIIYLIAYVSSHVCALFSSFNLYNSVVSLLIHDPSCARYYPRPANLHRQSAEYTPPNFTSAPLDSIGIKYICRLHDSSVHRLDGQFTLSLRVTYYVRQDDDRREGGVSKCLR